MLYKHQNDSGFDLYSTEDVVIPQNSFEIVPTSFNSKYACSSTPFSSEQFEGYRYVGMGLYLWPKSGSDWLIGGGVVDVDYDEQVFVKVANITNKPLVIKKGQAVCQAVIQPVYQRIDFPRGECRHKTGGIKDQYDSQV
jgi:dUTPase